MYELDSYLSSGDREPERESTKLSAAWQLTTNFTLAQVQQQQRHLPPLRFKGRPRRHRYKSRVDQEAAEEQRRTTVSGDVFVLKSPFQRTANKLAALKLDIENYRLRQALRNRAEPELSVRAPEEVATWAGSPKRERTVAPAPVVPEVKESLISRLTEPKKPHHVFEPDIFLKVACIDETAPLGSRDAFQCWARLHQNAIRVDLRTTLSALLIPTDYRAVIREAQSMRKLYLLIKLQTRTMITYIYFRLMFLKHMHKKLAKKRNLVDNELDQRRGSLSKKNKGSSTSSGNNLLDKKAPGAGKYLEDYFTAAFVRWKTELELFESNCDKNRW